MSGEVLPNSWTWERRHIRGGRNADRSWLLRGRPLNTVRTSVVITSYNQKAYLVEAVESVLDQSRPPDEIVIADDASIDGTQTVIQQYEQKHPGRVIGVLAPHNIGTPNNRNSGLARITGDVVFILDGDDRFLPSNIERSLAELAANPEYGSVYSNVALIDESGRHTGVRDGTPQPVGDVFYEVASGMFGILRNMVIRVPLLRSVGFLDKRLAHYDGYDLTVRLAERSRIGYVAAVLAEYRVHPGGVSRSMVASEHIQDLAHVYRKLLKLTSRLDWEQQSTIQEIWNRRLTRFYVQHILEKPSPGRKQVERLRRLLIKRHIGVNEAIHFDDLIERYRT